jgi:Flp pilus assembly pilin Flp
MRKRQSGQSAIEYALILTLIAVLALVSLATLGHFVAGADNCAAVALSGKPVSCSSSGWTASPGTQTVSNANTAYVTVQNPNAPGVSVSTNSGGCTTDSTGSCQISITTTSTGVINYDVYVGGKIVVHFSINWSPPPPPTLTADTTTPPGGTDVNFGVSYVPNGQYGLNYSSSPTGPWTYTGFYCDATGGSCNNALYNYPQPANGLTWYFQASGPVTTGALKVVWGSPVLTVNMANPPDAGEPVNFSVSGSSNGSPGLYDSTSPTGPFNYTGYYCGSSGGTCNTGLYNFAQPSGTQTWYFETQDNGVSSNVIAVTWPLMDLTVNNTTPSAGQTVNFSVSKIWSRSVGLYESTSPTGTYNYMGYYCGVSNGSCDTGLYNFSSGAGTYYFKGEDNGLSSNVVKVVWP